MSRLRAGHGEDAVDEFGGGARQRLWPASWFRGSWGRRVEGGTHGMAPGVGLEGFAVFVLSHLHGLEHGLAEIGEGGSGSGLDVPFGDGGEQARQGQAEVASKEKIA